MAEFSDVRRLSDPHLRWLLTRIDQRDMVLALKGAEEELTQRVWANVTHRVGIFLEREMSTIGEVDDDQVQAARQRIGALIDAGLRSRDLALDPAATGLAPSRSRRIVNPYITGNPVRGRQVFFGREDDFAYVEQRLRTERDGIVLLFVGGRRSGKTSIMFQILDGRLGPEFLPVFIDMQQLAGTHGDGELLGRIARTVIEGLGDERLVVDYYDFATGNPIITFDRLLADVGQIFPGRRLLFLVDEAEILRDKVIAGEITGSVLTYLAAALESRRVSYFLTGSRGLAEGEQADWRRLLGKGDYQEISFLSHADTSRLVREPVAGQVTYAEGVVEAIYQLTYGHPFYTQLICTNAVDHLNGAGRTELTRDDLDEVVGTIVNNPPPQLVYDWDQFGPSEQLALSLLSEVCQAAHAPVAPQSLLQAVADNGYPVDLSAETLHVVLDGLDERMVLERSAGGYHFLVDLVRLWIRRSRSVWRLVEEQGPVVRRPRWRVPAAAAAAVVVLAVAAVLLSRGGPQPRPQVPAGPRFGDLWLASFPPDTQVEVVGPLDSDSPAADTVRTTPNLVDGPPGPYRVTARHPLYAVQVETLQVVAGRRDTVYNRLVRLAGRLTVAPLQAGARVRVRGEREPLDTSATGGFQELALPTGAYAVEASLAGHQTWSGRVEVAADAAQRVAPDLDADVGGLYVDSQPPGATVRTGAGAVGTTPVRLPGLAVGSHALQLSLPDYQVVDTVQEVRFQRTDTLLVVLTLQPGVLAIATTPPGAAVAIDGRMLADTLTPARITRPPRTYRVRLERPGYDAHDTTVHLGPGASHSLRVDLVPQYGCLQVVRPYSGTLTVDGVETRRGPLGYIELPVGRHRVQLDGREVKEVDITRGDTIPVRWD